MSFIWDSFFVYICEKCQDYWDAIEGYCPHCAEPLVAYRVGVDHATSRKATDEEISAFER